ncbi:MAG: hypothetical protein QM784_27160 [Polyangiaceae bacterium]
METKQDGPAAHRHLGSLLRRSPDINLRATGHAKAQVNRQVNRQRFDAKELHT